MPGTSSANSSISLALRSTETAERPVILPPGRARLAMNPEPTGSPTPAMTMGMVDVARRAAIVAAVAHATVTSTLLLTSSVTTLGSRSNDSFSSQATLHELCRVMGLPGKPDGMTGAEVEKYLPGRPCPRDCGVLRERCAQH